MGFAARQTIATLNVQTEATALAAADYQKDDSDSYWMRFGAVADPKLAKHTFAGSNSTSRNGRNDWLALAAGTWKRDRRTFNSMTSIRSRHLDDFWQAMKEQTNGSPTAQQSWLTVQDWLGITKTTQNPVGYRTTADWRLADAASVSMADVVDGVIAQNESPPVTFKPVIFKPEPQATDIPAWRDSAAGRSIDVQLNRESLVYEPIYQDGHWFAGLTNLDTNDHDWVPVYQVDFIKQGVIVPHGNWRIEFYYAPRWVTLSVVVAIAGLAVWLLLSLLTVLDRRSAPDSATSASSSIRRAR